MLVLSSGLSLWPWRGLNSLVMPEINKHKAISHTVLFASCDLQTKMSRLPRGLLGDKNHSTALFTSNPTTYSELRIQILAPRNQYVLKLLRQYTRSFIPRLPRLLQGKCSLSLSQPCHVLWGKCVKRSRPSSRDKSLCLQPGESADPLVGAANRTCDLGPHRLVTVRKCIILIWELTL